MKFFSTLARSPSWGQFVDVDLDLSGHGEKSSNLPPVRNAHEGSRISDNKSSRRNGSSYKVPRITLVEEPRSEYGCQYGCFQFDCRDYDSSAIGSFLGGIRGFPPCSNTESDTSTSVPAARCMNCNQQFLPYNAAMHWCGPALAQDKIVSR